MDLEDGVEFQRRLLKEVEKHSNILHRRGTRVARQASWAEISKVLDLSAEKLELMWTAIYKEYTNILLSKTIQRDSSPSDWPLFHDMSFAYYYVKRYIMNKMGGLQPPILTAALPRTHDSCPCCSTTNESDASKIRLPYLQRCRRRLELIQLVSQYPILYANDINEKASQSKIWQHIAQTLGLSIAVVQSRWRFCKQRYLQELMRVKQSNGKYKAKWPNYKDMDFMRRHLQSEIEGLEKLKVNMDSLVSDIKRTEDAGNQDPDGSFVSSPNTLSSGEE